MHEIKKIWLLAKQYLTDEIWPFPMLRGSILEQIFLNLWKNCHPRQHESKCVINIGRIKESFQIMTIHNFFSVIFALGSFI